MRSLVGLIPLYAIEVLEQREMESRPDFLANVEWFIKNRPDLVGHACYAVGNREECKRYVLSIADPGQFHRIAVRLWDPAEFLSDHGVCSLSKQLSFAKMLSDKETRESDARVVLLKGDRCGFARLERLSSRRWPARPFSARERQEGVSEVTLSHRQSMRIFSRFPGRSKATARQYWRERFSVTYRITYLASASKKNRL